MNWWLTQGRFAGTNRTVFCSVPVLIGWFPYIIHSDWLIYIQYLSDWVGPTHYAFWFVGVPRLTILIGWLVYPVHSNWMALLLSVQFGSSVMLDCLRRHGLQLCRVSLSITNSWNLLRLMSIESVMPSNHLILSSPSHPAFSLSGCQILWISPLLRESWKKYLL